MAGSEHRAMKRRCWNSVPSQRSLKVGCEASVVFRTSCRQCVWFSKVFKKTNKNKWSKVLRQYLPPSVFHCDIDQRTRLCRVRRMHAPNLKKGAPRWRLAHDTQYSPDGHLDAPSFPCLSVLLFFLVFQVLQILWWSWFFWFCWCSRHDGLSTDARLDFRVTHVASSCDDHNVLL